MKFDTNSDMEQEEEALYYYSSNKNEIFQTQDDTLFIKPGITAYNLRVSVSTHIGKVRGNHEDNFYLEGLRLNEIFRNDFSATYTISDADGMSFAVFDGMGGAAYGEIASEIAVQTMKKYERRLKNAEGMRAVDQIVTEFVTEANNSICDMLREKNCLSGGTTFAMLYLIDGLAKLYYLGDSRIYMQDEEDLICLTRDHTLANQKLDAGIYTEAQAKKSADQHRLTLYVGVDKNGLGLNADSRPPVALQPGRKFLLCTDGLIDMCSEQEIQDILSQDYFNEAAVLVQTAVNYGGIDNVTCIVLEVIPIEEPAELESDPML